MVTFEIIGYTKEDVGRAEQMVLESQLPVYGYVNQDTLSSYAKVREKHLKGCAKTRGGTLKKSQKDAYKRECHALSRAASLSAHAVQVVVPFDKWCTHETSFLIREAALKYKAEDEVGVNKDDVAAPVYATQLTAATNTLGAGVSAGSASRASSASSAGPGPGARGVIAETSLKGLCEIILTWKNAPKKFKKFRKRCRNSTMLNHLNATAAKMLWEELQSSRIIALIKEGQGFFPVKRMPFAEFCDREYEITSPGVHRALWEEFERHVIFSLVNHVEFNPNRRNRIAGARPRKVLAAAREALQFKRMPAQSSSARVNQNLFYANLEARKPQQSPPQNAARVQTHQAGPLVAADTAASDTATSLSSPPPPSLTEAEHTPAEGVPMRKQNRSAKQRRLTKCAAERDAAAAGAAVLAPAAASDIDDSDVETDSDVSTDSDSDDEGDVPIVGLEDTPFDPGVAPVTHVLSAEFPQHLRNHQSGQQHIVFAVKSEVAKVKAKVKVKMAKVKATVKPTGGERWKCQDCRLTFTIWKECRNHLDAAKHMGRPDLKLKGLMRRTRIASTAAAKPSGAAKKKKPSGSAKKKKPSRVRRKEKRAKKRAKEEANKIGKVAAKPQPKKRKAEDTSHAATPTSNNSQPATENVPYFNGFRWV
eukprot:gene16392-30558_t